MYFPVTFFPIEVRGRQKTFPWNTSEAALHKCSFKKVFWKYTTKLQVLSCDFAAFIQNFFIRTLFVLMICTFLSWFFGHIGKRLDKTAKVISRFVTSRTGKQTIVINILPDISKNKSNQTKKFGRLTEYSVRNLFFFREWSRKDTLRLVSVRPLLVC